MADGLEIDHLFVCVAPDGADIRRLEELGLRESYRRAHPGQGTANACYCFDNAYLELLWVTDPIEISTPEIGRTRLAERLMWRDNGACPFGIALRGSGRLPFATWDYCPPYLPEGMTIPVARASEDPSQPFLFRSPGDRSPDEWTDGRAETRQRHARLVEITGLRLDMPAGIEPDTALRQLARRGLMELATGQAAWRMYVMLSRSDDSTQQELSLPEFILK